MKPLAPVAVFAFKRLDLLRQTLASLERCKEFQESPVIVFSDGARLNQAGEEDAVARLRQWLRPWCARHGATFHEAGENKGLRRSIISGVTAVVEQYERVIVLEDDLIVSPHFLTFMNEALEGYRERADIFQVCGYFVPHRQKLPTVGLLRVGASWGWATWRRAWKYYRDDAPALLAEVRAKDVNKFNINGSYDYVGSLEANAVGTQNTWGIRWYASMFLRGGLALHPGQSLTRNIGFGADASNCSDGNTAKVFRRQPINSRRIQMNWESLPQGETEAFATALEGFYRWQNYQWAKPTLRQRIRARWIRLFKGAGTR